MALTNSDGGEAMMRFSNTTIAIFTIAVFLLASPASSGDLVRVDFVDVGGIFQNEGGVFGQGNLFTCDADPSPLDFDLIDIEDDPTACGFAGSPFSPDTEGVGQSDVSGGGRWKLALVGGTDPTNEADANRHAVGINFPGDPSSAKCNSDTGLASLSLGGENANGGTNTCACGGTCFVQLRMAADRVFKKGATRQAFDITIVEWNIADQLWRPAAGINHIDPLYICDLDPNNPDPDRKVLQTDGCDGEPSVEEAEVSSVDGTSSSILGRWDLPLEIFLHRVPRTATDDSGGSTCELPQLPKGAVCTGGGDCCSGTCKRNGTCR
jgi:hypothetical protein